MLASGDNTTSLISLVTLIIAFLTLSFAGLNFLKMREPFATMAIKPAIVMMGGSPRGVEYGTIILHYKNAVNNIYLNKFSINGKICCKNREIDISRLLPKNIRLAPNQEHEVRIEVLRILNQNGVELDAININVYVDFNFSFKFYMMEKKQHFRYKWDRTLTSENQWSPA